MVISWPSYFILSYLFTHQNDCIANTTGILLTIFRYWIWNCVCTYSLFSRLQLIPHFLFYFCFTTSAIKKWQAQSPSPLCTHPHYSTQHTRPWTLTLTQYILGRASRRTLRDAHTVSHFTFIIVLFSSLHGLVPLCVTHFVLSSTLV